MVSGVPPQLSYQLPFLYATASVVAVRRETRMAKVIGIRTYG